MYKKHNQSNFTNNSSYNMNKKKTAYTQKYITKKSLGQELIAKPTFYTSLTSKDSLYRQNRHLLKNSQFKFIVRKTTRQLNILLHLNDKVFFQQLEKNQSLKICLQSCLITFPRRIYNRLQKYEQKVQHLDFKDQSYLIYSVLMKIVLIIYLRISRAQDTLSKALVYNEWLIDIPKLLDLVAIYGQSNPKIVQQIIENTYKMNNNYDNDTLTFFNLIQKGKLDQLQRKQMDDIDFSPQSLLAKNYGSREEFMMSQTMKYLFIIKDILFNLYNFVKYFPKKYVYELATDYKIQERLINGFSFFMYHVNNSWKLGNYKERYFKLHFQDLRQSMIIYFLSQFQLLKRIVRLQEAQMKDVEQAAHNTYQTYCLLFASQKPKVYHIQYNKLINNLIEQTKDYIFFLNGSKVINSSQKTKQKIDFCQQYEKNYRSKHKLAINQRDIEDIYTKNRINLAKFNITWQEPQTQQIIRYKQRVDKQKKRSYALKQQDYSYINKLKYGKIQNNCDKQYDDEPQQQQFNRIQLENQYIKLEKSNINLDLSMKQQKPKRKYVEKGKKQLNNSSLSFFYNSMYSEDNLSNFDLNLNKQLQQEDQLSLSIVKSQNTSFVNLQKQLFQLSKQYQIAKINQYGKDQQFQIQFQWNDQDLSECHYQNAFRDQLSINDCLVHQKQDNIDLSFV